MAVLLVMASHVGVPIASGDAGVTAFFVLSGYLITRLLMEEGASVGAIDLTAFYRRRVARLAPALLLLLGFVAVIGLANGWAGDWRLGILTSLAYVSNWPHAFGHLIDPLGHTWSLAIEEQFYILWPAALMLLGARRSCWLAIAGIALAAVARTLSDGSFEYFSTITRADAILLGCLLALRSVSLPTRAAPVGLAILLSIGIPGWSHDITLPLAMIGAALVVCAEWRPLGVLAPIGRRAYGLYLWDWPLTIALGLWGTPMTFAVAELSYRLVERPIVRRVHSRRPRPEPLAAGVGLLPLSPAPLPVPSD